MSFHGGVFMSDRAGLPTGIVYSLVIQPDRKIVIGGHFLDIALGHGPHTLIGGKPNFARLHADGNLDFSFGYHPVHGPHPGYFSNRPVYSVALMPNGKVVASGDFEHVNGLARNGIARFFSNGTVDPGFDAGSLFHYFNPAGQLAVQPDGKVVAGVVSLYRLPSDGGGGTPPVAGVPQVTGVAPNPVGQGEHFTIAGNGLALADSVVIGGVETYIEANTAQFITVMLDDLHPLGPGQIVEVTTPGGIDSSTQVDVVPGALPTITSVVPAQVYPGTKLTINGFNLTPTALPMINGFYTDGVSASATKIEVMVRGTQPVGLGQVLYVPGQNGKAAYATIDVILPPLPVLGPVSPDPVKQGEQLRISGDNLDTATYVEVGTTKAAIVSASKTQVVVSIANDHPLGPTQSVKVTVQFGTWDFGTVEVIAGPTPAPNTQTFGGSGGCASQSGSESRATFLPGLIAVLALLALRRVNSTGRWFRRLVG
jgi:hypothetical protein